MKGMANNMMYLKDDIISFVSLRCNKSKKEVRQVIDEYINFIVTVMKDGDEVYCQPLGIFSFSNCKGWEARSAFNCATGLPFEIPKQEPFSRPLFKFNGTFKKEIKQKSNGNPFKIEKRVTHRFYEINEDEIEDDDECEV